MNKEEIKLINPYDEKYKALLKFGIEAEPTGNYTIRFLEICGRARAIDDLNDIRKKDIRDLNKLMRTINLQLNSKELILDKTKLQKTTDGILEFKANKGCSRLFGFMSGESENKEIIICSHGYWKTDGKGNNEKQNAAFRLAKKFQLLYLQSKN